MDKADVKAWHKCYGGHQGGRLWRHNSHFSISVPLLRYVSFHLSHLITGLRKRNLILLTRTHTLFYKKPNKVLCRHPAHYLDAEKSSGKIIIIKKKNHQVFNLLSSTYSSLHSCDLKSARARSFKGLSGPTHSIQRHLSRKRVWAEFSGTANPSSMAVSQQNSLGIRSLTELSQNLRTFKTFFNCKTHLHPALCYEHKATHIQNASPITALS